MIENDYQVHVFGTLAKKNLKYSAYVRTSCSQYTQYGGSIGGIQHGGITPQHSEKTLLRSIASGLFAAITQHGEHSVIDLKFLMQRLIGLIDIACFSVIVLFISIFLTIF